MMPVDTIEEWRAIERTAGNYSVSSWGRVRRDTHGYGGLAYPGRIRKLSLNRYGYLHVSLYVEGRYVGMPFVHVLVAEAFLGARPTPGHQVNHIDGVKTNNRVSNLEWVTPSQNTRHALDHGLMIARVFAPKLGATNHKSKLTEADVHFIRHVDHGLSDAALGRKFGVAGESIRAVRLRKHWAHVP